MRGIAVKHFKGFMDLFKFGLLGHIEITKEGSMLSYSTESCCLVDAVLLSNTCGHHHITGSACPHVAQTLYSTTKRHTCITDSTSH